MQSEAAGRSRWEPRGSRQAPPKFGLKSNVGVCGTTGARGHALHDLASVLTLRSRHALSVFWVVTAPVGQLQFVPNKGEMFRACIWHSGSEFKSC